MASAKVGPRVWFAGTCVTLLAGCAAPRTQLAPIPKGAIKAEQEKQRELALEDNQRQQARLDSLGLPILRNGTSLCTSDAGTHLSARFATAYEYEPLWRTAAARVLEVGDTLTVIGVTPGGAAAKAGLRRGDRVLTVEGERVATGSAAVKDFSEKLSAAKKNSAAGVTLMVQRSSGPEQVPVELDHVCDYSNIVVQGDELNAYSDGTNIVMTSTMMRFVNDEELQVVYAHEFAHNAMGHLKAKKKNSLFGALLGALGDLAMASRGINTGGYYTTQGAKAGALSFSQDFEREADYVGLYAMALAGLELTPAPSFWRHMAQANPKSIGLAYTHPTTAERFVRMEQAIAEIDHKRATNLALQPEMKNSKARPLPSTEAVYALGRRSDGTESSAGLATSVFATSASVPGSQTVSGTDPRDSAQAYTQYASDARVPSLANAKTADLAAMPSTKEDPSGPAAASEPGQNPRLWDYPNFRSAVSDLLRLHVIESWKEVEVGRLRAVAGAGFDRVSAMEYYLERLRHAYGESTYLQSESAAPVIELYRNGRPFAEYSRAGLSEIKAP